MDKIGYHTFRKPKKDSKGKRFFRWYYYFYDSAGKKIQRACPGCKNRSDAESYIRTLPDFKIGPGPVLIKTIAETMYIPGSDHYKRRAELGRSIDMETMKEARWMTLKIIADFGETAIEELTPVMVTKLLINMDCSGGQKNRYIQILGEIYQEAAWYDCKVIQPKFPTFARKVRKADKFTAEELNKMFVPENFPNETMFLFFLCCLSAGLRISEARAIRRKQLLFERKILVVDGFCRKDGSRTNYNKKGNSENPKFRVVFLSDLVITKLKNYINQHDFSPDDFIFTADPGKPYRIEYAEDMFSRALVQAGIAIDLKKLAREAARAKKEKKDPPMKIIFSDTDYKNENIYVPGGRKLVPHSLRYTYISRMRRELSADELKPMTGHITEDNVDYYNQKNLDDTIAALSPRAESAANSLFA